MSAPRDDKENFDRLSGSFVNNATDFIINFNKEINKTKQEGFKKQCGDILSQMGQILLPTTPRSPDAPTKTITTTNLKDFFALIDMTCPVFSYQNYIEKLASVVN